ncbi:MAG TPA: glycosyltransferase family 87 protein [Terriglobales bacterium]|nr:glycosyltransferase family 87 protein [Terriglobales bacterium]
MQTKSKLGLALSLLLAWSMWFYVQHVVIGHQQTEAALHGIPRGNLSDLYPRWLGTRELLLHHRNPYTPEVTRDIQIGYYGRPLDASRPGDPKDQMGFAYPLYVVFLIAPTISFPFSSVRFVAHWFFILLTAFSVPLWLRAMRWRVSPVLTATLVTLTLGTLPAVQGIKLEQLSLLVGGMVAVCVLLLVSNSLVLAGVLLAFATIKPQLVLFMVAWLLLWACGNYRERRRFLWSFGLTMAILFTAAEFVMPGWVGQFVKAIAAYREYTGRPVSILAVLATPALGQLLSALLLIVLAIICWRARCVSVGDPTFALVSSAVLGVTVVVIPMTSLYNQILLLPAVLLLVRHGRFLWGKDPLTRLLCVISGSLMVWPWVAALTLSLSSIAVSSALVQKAWAAPLWTSMAIPVAVLMLLARLGALTLPDILTAFTAAHPTKVSSA